MKNRAFTVMEYMSLIAIIIAGLIGMQVYIKRSLQGRMKAAMQDLNGAMLYSPGATQSKSVVTKTVSEDSKSRIIRDANDEKFNVGTVDSEINQTTERSETTSSLDSEPGRF